MFKRMEKKKCARQDEVNACNMIKIKCVNQNVRMSYPLYSITLFFITHCAIHEDKTRVICGIWGDFFFFVLSLFLF